MVIVYCLQALHRMGGIERVITTKANRLAELGYTVHIITTDQREQAPAFPLHSSIALHDLGLNYEHDNELGRFGRIRALYRKRSLHRERLEGLLRKLGADITISTFFQEAPILPKLRDGSKKVLEMHTSRYARVNMYPKEARLMRLYGRWRQWQDERLARQYDAFVILTEVERPLYKYQKNLYNIPNPCVLPEYGYSDLSKPQAIAVGRLEYVKNFESLIRAWQSVAERYPEWQLAIYGDGPLGGQLARLIEDLGLQGQVSLKGNHSRMDERYRESSMCLMTSHFEGLPMVLLEAQTCGLPIVAYDCPSGPREVVIHGRNGLLVAEGDETALANAIISLIEDPTRLHTLAEQAREDAQRYDLETIIARWQVLFALLTAE